MDARTDARTDERTIFNIGILLFYEVLSVCIAAFLFSWAIFCFWQMSTIDQAVKREWDDEAQDDDEVDPESVAVGIKTWLLLTGVLETLMGFFQFVNILVVHSVYELVKDKAGISNQWARLSPVDRLIYLWATLSAIVHIFFDVTHFLFNGHITPNKQWFLVVWRAIGEVDQRYVNGDSSITVASGILALVAGPGCAIFAWSIYTQRPHRHISGILVTATVTYTQVRDSLPLSLSPSLPLSLSLFEFHVQAMDGERMTLTLDQCSMFNGQ